MTDKIILFKEKLEKEFPNSLIEIKDDKVFIDNFEMMNINFIIKGSDTILQDHDIDLYEELCNALINGYKFHLENKSHIEFISYIEEKLEKDFPRTSIKIQDNKIYINDKPVGINVDFNSSLLLNSEYQAIMFEDIYNILKKEILSILK